ncbi:MULTISPECIES: hypothetical protein [unclassified Rhizobium]|jgi:hypothetical protein|uniref:hypothetical protein n=1 Tax=unclassified Rhizobium TaxID=2613769 RepID=UPI000647A7EF|nr:MULTISPECIES: hypothetical protein [unclassified Rhizobium]OJY63916.1 MAG: hypothetical protein BGP09_01505 [Rhizobium sp. 60-20]RKD60913.1 hypothetical protein BJ928_108200 [Rhizobium sp. WW_1]
MVIKRQTGSLLQFLLLPLRLVIAVLVIISEIARPVYRPLVNWFSSLSVVKHFGDFVASLPRAVILVLFVVPLAIAEPLKIYALFVIARGHVISGLVIIAAAYLMSFLLVERLFHAGREKLLTYGWLRWIMDRVETVRRWVAEMKESVMATVHAWLG